MDEPEARFLFLKHPSPNAPYGDASLDVMPSRLLRSPKLIEILCEIWKLAL
jgi:hypothetical protein